MKLIHTTFAAGAISKYDALASSHPHLATSLVSLSTYTAAELVRQAQSIKKAKTPMSSSIASKQPSSIDSVVRGGGGLHLRQGLTGVLLMGLLGFALHGPWICFWFQCLETIFPRRNPCDIAYKIVLDQAIGCPIYYVLLGMATGLAEGYGIAGSIHRDGMASAPCDQFLACATGPTKAANSGRWFGMGHISVQTNGQTRYHHDCRSHGTS